MQLIHITDKTGKKLEDQPLDLAVVREKLAASKGQTYWRSLEELSEQPGFTELLKREFPHQAPKDFAPLARRDFVKLMGAALALAGLSGCAFQPQEKIVPYVKAPEELLPGIAAFYATAIPFQGYALGVLAEAHEGRPTKIEGNPQHPSSNGAADIWAQASILEMYDPDRSQFIRRDSASTSWDEFAGVAAAQVNAARANGGSGFALLTGAITSPSLLAQIAQLQRTLPAMRWVSYEPVNRDNLRAGAQIAFGKDLHTLYHFDRADVVVSLDCDFLLEEPGRVAHAREFIANRKLDGQVANPAAAKMNRLYVAESTPTITGAMADHRFPMKASQIEGMARALADAVGVPGAFEAATLPGNMAKVAQTIATDLKANRGRVLVCAGSHQSPAVHAIAHAINAFLGSVGPQSAVSYHAPIEGNPTPHEQGLRDLVAEMNAGRVQTLVVMGTNPAYSAPYDLKFRDAIKKVKTTIHCDIYNNETSDLCNWHIPQAHSLEYWGDARSLDGTLTIIQPIIQPLYEAAKAPTQILSALLGSPNDSAYDTLRAGFQMPTIGIANSMSDAQTAAFDTKWAKIVHDGFQAGTAAPTVGVTLRALNLPTPGRVVQGLEINFRPDGTIWDGRFGNNAWLQECPKPYSRITWDNAIFVAPDTAHEKGWKTNQEVTVSANGQSITGAIFMLPGQPKDTLTMHLGYGREYGKIATGAGFNASKLRAGVDSWWTGGAEIEPTGRVYKIATTSQHNLIAPNGKETTIADALLKTDDAKTKLIDDWLAPEGADLDIDGTHARDIVRAGTFAKFKAGILPTRPSDKKGIPLTWPHNSDKVREAYLEPAGHGSEHGEEDSGDHEARPKWQENREAEGFPSFYPRDNDPLAQTPYRDASVNVEETRKAKAEGRDGLTYQWGMSVDLNSCIGCNACVIGCQAENNSATVGKDQVLMGRELHWIRIDTYYRGSFENPKVYFEPMMCQHCEKAPCAPVCPFNAVMNSPEGVNEQIYNRCVGTKYCENNCPYKVRRFNFLQYSDQQTPVITLMQNPDVTVRSRGVMEKCTYCIQRITHAKWQAEKEQRRVLDGEIKTACQQTCPTNAIVFGDINDPNSELSKLKRGPLTFGILTEFNTLPRTTYMAKFRNPNPTLAALDKEFDAETLRGYDHSAGEGEEAHAETSSKPSNSEHAEGAH